MGNIEKRKYKRLPIKLDLSCRQSGSTGGTFHTGRTVNVSPGGLYFESKDEAFKPGNLLKIELSIPPTLGLLELGGSISGFGKVLRIRNICDSRSGADLSSAKSGVALEFSQPLKLHI